MDNGQLKENAKTMDNYKTNINVMDNGQNTNGQLTMENGQNTNGQLTMPACALHADRDNGQWTEYNGQLTMPACALYADRDNYNENTIQTRRGAS